MTTLLYAEIKLKADMKDKFLDLVNSPEGFPLPNQNPDLFLRKQQFQLMNLVKTFSPLGEVGEDGGF